MDQNSERYTVQILPPTSDSQAQFSFPEQTVSCGRFTDKSCIHKKVCIFSFV